MGQGTAQIEIASLWNGEPADPAEIVRLELSWGTDGLRIAVAAPFWNDPPPPGRGGSTEGLWEFEVVELFVASAADPARYTEIEIGPFGHYLVLLFSGVRQRLAAGVPLDLGTTRSGPTWTADALLDRDHLPAEPWLANAYAIHGVGAARRCLAAHPLPGPRADFHQPRRFPPLG